ncbi:MAG: glycosyltransferase [Candidatus Electrothrix sp. YB6]
MQKKYNINDVSRYGGKESASKEPVKKIVLHLSHTDIRADSRILKEIEAHRKTGGYKVYAIGLYRNLAGKTHSDIAVDTIRLASNKTKWNPRGVRHFLNLLELTLRMIRKSVKISPDAVHCHDTVVLHIGLIVKFATGAKLVYDAHELESNKNGQTKFKSQMTLLVEKFCWRSIDLLVSVSPSILRWYEVHLGKKKNVLVLNSPVVDNEIIKSSLDKSKSGYFRDHFGIPDESLIFIYLGHLIKGRGIELILNAFSSNSVDSHVVFMGKGYLSDVIEKRADLKNNIHLHPPVKHDQVVQLTKSADVGLCLIERVSLSDYYCLPNKLFEYVFSGLPVLASNFPDLKNYIDSYGMGISCDVNSEMISKSMQRIKKVPLGKIKSDLDELGWHRQAERLVAAYETLLQMQ